MSKSSFVRYFTFFIAGALIYSLIEIAWRSYTHWTMGVTGGLCMSALYYINKHCKSIPVASRALIGCAVITLAEFLVGIAVNFVCKWNVWDYSSLPFNFMGQICLLYSTIWYFLCFPAFFICEWVERSFFENPRKKRV